MIDKYISQIDTDRFGYKVVKLTEKGNAIIDELMPLFKKEGVKLIISRENTANIDIINNLEREGFELKDTQLTYSYNLGSSLGKEQPKTTNFSLRPSTVNDAEQIAKIAKQCFVNYGHYFADTRLNHDDCLNIYSDWAKKSCLDNNVSDYIVVAEHNEEILGFLSIIIDEDINGRYAKGGIGAVSPNAQNLGVFKALNLHLLKKLKDKGLYRLENNVLATNFPVNAAYIKLGFLIIRSEVTLHCWPNEE